MTKKEKNPINHKQNENWESKLAKIQKRNKKKNKPEIPNDRDQIVFNPLREGRASHHFKRPSPMVEDEVKKFKENNKVIKQK